MKITLDVSVFSLDGSIIRDSETGEPVGDNYRGLCFTYSEGRPGKALFYTGRDISGEREWNCIRAEI